jgi:hypothetical protein
MPHTYGLVAGNMILGYTSLGDDEHWRSLHRWSFDKNHVFDAIESSTWQGLPMLARNTTLIGLL